MVDTRIRKNERCVIGLPACDYVFSSTRSCFIAYGFATSALERDLLKGILQERGIEPVEAGGQIDPGKFVFCTKICSKIIVAQFCVVLLNRDTAGHNANVNIEYGLMLGHISMSFHFNAMPKSFRSMWPAWTRSNITKGISGHLLFRLLIRR